MSDSAAIAAIRAVIDDLDTARAEGRIYTYGQIQRALRAALATAQEDQ
ncbi:TPA: hypothetical protein OQU49_004439 [Shigella flexneri]|nr:hypothetical protein [Shigella flexneri]